ncbi:TonB-dependent receptor [Niveibacterium terrae]|uniref:TonB-dependent receptor n=1 Tax=Niveibacterium terrae TaxID=3373598 RepID=UPI003A941CA5
MKPLALAIASLGVYSASLSAYADTSPEKIEVTGSRIKRVDAETASPVEVVTRADIAKSGSATVADALRTITANAGSFSENWTNSFSPGASGISLRGLGQKSTLVLINGRRAPNYGFAQNLSDTYFDLNSLPASAIERVEVLKDGASAIYGSDAIAGVVNVILRQDFKGLEVSAEQGISDENDLPESHVSITGGLGTLSENGYNVLASLDYFKRTGITYADRAFTRDSDTSSKPGGAFGWSNTGTYRTGTYTRVAMANCPFGTATVDAAKFGAGYSGTACMYNPAEYQNAFPDTERINFFSHGTFNLGSSLQAFGEVFGSHTSTQQTFTPGAISTSGSSTRYDPTTGGVAVIDTRLPVGNAANPYSTPARFGYTFFDVGPRSADITTDAYRLLGGLKGSLKTWDWEFALTSGQSKSKQEQYNRINAIALQKAIADGSYNFLNPTKEQADALRLNLHREATSKLYTADANIRGDLFSLPAGAVGAVFGVDFRREQLDDVPDQWLTGGYVLGQGATETHGSRNVGAGFFEFAIPVLKTVEIGLAGRGDKYSDFGSAFSPSAKIKFTPMKELAFRASWGKGFRAPTLAENSQSNSTYFTTITDTTPPAGHPELKNKSFNIAGVLVGNPDLKAEKSTTVNFGIVAQPVKAIDFTVDYYRIKQKDLVGTDSLSYILAHENDAQYAGQVVRDATTGQVLYISNKYRNLEYVQTSGIDITANWRLGQVGPAKLSTKFDWNYLIDWKTPPAAGADAVNYAGNDGWGSVFHRNQGKLKINWDAPVWSVSLGINYLDGYNHLDPVTDSDGNVVQDHVNAYITTDIFTSYNVTKALQATFSIQNIENRNPPYDASYSAGYETYDYNLRGRYYRLGVNYKF